MPSSYPHPEFTLPVPCPHCLQHTLPTNDICPGCRRDVTEPPKHQMVRLVVSRSTKFPNNCHRCDAPTTRRQKLREVHREENRDRVESGSSGDGVLLLHLLGFLFGPLSVLGLFVDSHSDPTHSVMKITLGVPTCAVCKLDIQILGHDIHEYSLAIAAHRNFVQRMRAMIDD